MSTYRDLLKKLNSASGRMREAALRRLPHELQLQALWFSGQMGRDFIAIDGRSVRITQFGHWNHGAGPDFLHAAVEIDGVKTSGPLELDHRLSDWEAHGHAVNEAFNKVILHVVFVDEGKCHYTRTENHREVPQVIIPVELLEQALNTPMFDVADAHMGRCFAPLAEMEVIHLDHLMGEAARHRAAMKARRRARTVDALGEDEWLWQALAETLGYRPNHLAMTLLAQRLPIKKLICHEAVSESVIFGAAGFLTTQIHEQASADSRDYLRELWKSWWQVRGDYEPVPERRIPWTLSGIRPVNHPQRRLSCLAEVARQWPAFKKASLSANGVEDFFESLGHFYWSHHYTFKSKRSDRALALMGADRIRDFQINHLMPAHLAVDDHVTWGKYRAIPAPALSEKVEKASRRLFGHSSRRKTYLRKAWQHQALLQIYQDFCLQDISNCDECPFPEQLAQWRKK